VHGAQADGNDVLEVYRVTRVAVERARSGGGVTLIELKTYRRSGHAEHDDQRYVPPGEVARWAETNDPLDRYLKRLTTETGWATPADIARVDTRVHDEVEDALHRCEHDPEPAGEDALDGVLANAKPSPSRGPWGAL
jgi:TPP-dependent pyruvate/acetoin dehydrogenase alpha subunit